jgi:glycine/D-amino acid oxidase-like deaminating enzyme
MTMAEADRNKSDNTIDIAIIGGGIAGLWTLARLRQSGYQAILLEAHALGCEQTGASQGIIHGGTKYALTGKLTHSSQSIQQMPQRWKQCLDGSGEVDLSQARKLSDHQYLWSNKNLASRLTGFFASKVMSSRMRHLSANEYVPPFTNGEFHGELYQLDEPVLDVQSVIDTIREQFSAFIFQMTVAEVSKVNSESSYGYLINNTISAATVIFTAGAGNEALLACVDRQQPQLQRRPLFMPMLKGSESVLPRMYAHCLGASALPKMTITSHQLAADHSSQEAQIVWYLGGEIAELGVGRSLEKQIQAAKQELQKLMPWMDFSSCQWSALAIDRAEPKMDDGSRPSEPAVDCHEQIITAWPVKLAMTPIMVDKILQQLQQLGIQKNEQSVEIKDMTLAKTTRLPWEKVHNWL